MRHSLRGLGHGIRGEGQRPYLGKSRLWPAICEDLLAGRYRPQPVKRVLISKPGGGERELGIPTVLDRSGLERVATAGNPPRRRRLLSGLSRTAAARDVPHVVTLYWLWLESVGNAAGRTPP